MLDIGWQELFLIAVVALIVVGPKDLPHALRAVTRVLRRARGLAREFQSGFDDIVREAELDEIRQQVNKVSRTSLAETVRDELDPRGELTGDFDPRDYGRDLESELRRGVGTAPEAAPSGIGPAPVPPASTTPASPPGVVPPGAAVEQAPAPVPAPAPVEPVAAAKHQASG